MTIFRCNLCGKTYDHFDIHHNEGRCPTKDCTGTIKDLVPQMTETVDHPNHYNWIPEVECIDVTEHFNFNLGNAIKYLWRTGKKGLDWREDLEKAMWYIQREIALREKGE